MELDSHFFEAEAVLTTNEGVEVVDIGIAILLAPDADPSLLRPAAEVSFRLIGARLLEELNV